MQIINVFTWLPFQYDFNNLSAITLIAQTEVLLWSYTVQVNQSTRGKLHCLPIWLSHASILVSYLGCTGKRPVHCPLSLANSCMLTFKCFTWFFSFFLFQSVDFCAVTVNHVPNWHQFHEFFFWSNTYGTWYHILWHTS